MTRYEGNPFNNRAIWLDFLQLQDCQSSIDRYQKIKVKKSDWRGSYRVTGSCVIDPLVEKLWIPNTNDPSPGHLRWFLLGKGLERTPCIKLV